MRVRNVFGDLEDARDREGFRLRSTRLGPPLGAEKAGASVYELEPGQRTFPYHFHYGNEEWLIVLRGRAMLRTPDGERELVEGDVVCFPAGPAGAHAVRNDTREPVRILIASTLNAPSVVVYPDSDKLGTRPGDFGDDHLNFPRSAAVDYWEGE